MVSESEERRSSSEYSLTRIRELALQGDVHYYSRRVHRHIENLNYRPEDIYTCLSMLTSAHYRGSVRYGKKPWLDEYLITYKAGNGQPDELYIKLMLNKNCLTIILESFHPEGWI